MAFGCDIYYYKPNSGGCSDYYNWYNSTYQNCCSRGWTTFAYWMMWIVITAIILIIIKTVRSARLRRQMMYSQQMLVN